MIIQRLPHCKPPPDLENSSIQTRTTLENKSDADVTTDVTFHIYELGVYEDGEPTQEKKLVGTYTEPGVTVPANSSIKFDVDAISIADCTEDKVLDPGQSPSYMRSKSSPMATRILTALVCAPSTLTPRQNFPC